MLPLGVPQFKHIPQETLKVKDTVLNISPALNHQQYRRIGPSNRQQV